MELHYCNIELLFESENRPRRHLDYITGNVFVDIGENLSLTLSLSLLYIFCSIFLLFIEPKETRLQLVLTHTKECTVN